MLSRLSFSFYDLRDSLWYRPAMMTLGAVVLAFVMLWIDDTLLQGSEIHTWWLFGGGVEGARGVLTAIATTMMTVVTTAFSITMVTLQLGSSQYSPRILRGFTGDRGNQMVLGIFISTFVYCLLILRSVRSELDDRRTFVPSLSITVSLLLALVCIGSLIYFFHHATRTIQASVILHNTASDAFGLIEEHFNIQGHEPMSERTRSLLSSLPVVARVMADRPGYLRGVDDSRLIELSREHDLLLTMEPRIGDHIFSGTSLLTVQQFTTPQTDTGEDDSNGEGLLERVQEKLEDIVTSGSTQVAVPENDSEDESNESSDQEQLVAALRWPFTIGMERTLNEDVLFGFQQLTDIGLRALSPGVNDPTTAMLCIDQLGEGLIRVQDTDDRGTVAVDEDGTPRVVYPPISFERFLEISLKHIRHYGAADPFVARHLVQVLHTIHRVIDNELARAAVEQEARTVVEMLSASDPLPVDLEPVRMAASWAYVGE